ncbi:MAG: hypothetical protein Kow0068_06910 [Marinilabiliales bacterium]
MKSFTYLISVVLLIIITTLVSNAQSVQSNREITKSSLIQKQSERSLIKLPDFSGLNASKLIKNSSKANTVLLTQDFSSTTFPPTGWTSTVISGTLNWSRGVGSQTYATFSNVGTTADNGYAFVDSDGNGGAGGAENCVLTTPAINCTGYNYVYLKFNEFFYQYAASTADVEVSNNGSTWTVVHSAHTGLGTNEATPNPWKQDIDISSIAANQATVFVRFHWTGSYDYYWFIDDVEVYARADYDAALSDRTNMYEYVFVPNTQFSPVSLPQEVTVWNAGGAAITNVSMTNTIYDGNTGSVLQTGSSNVIPSLAGNNTGTLIATSYTPPAGNGIYVSESIVSINETDAEASNDTLLQYLYVNDSIFARDDAMFTGFIDGSLGSNSSEIILGNTYTFTNYEVVTHVRAYVTGPQVGNQAQIVVYNFAGGVPTTQLAASNTYTFTTAGGQWLDLQMSGGPLTLNPGTYFFGVRQISTTVNLGIAYTENNFTPLTSFVKLGTDPFDTLSNFGYDVTFVIHPIVYCAGYQPIITPTYSHLCQGEQVTLISSTADSYTWIPGNQTTSSITVDQPGAYTVQTTYMGCTATSDTFLLNEYPKPIVDLGADTTVCDQIQLDAGSGFVSYQWTGGGTTQYLDVTATGDYSVTVSDNYCSNYDSIHVTVNASPTPVITGGGTYCDDDTVYLDAGAGYSNYTWSVGTSTNQFLQLDTSIVGLGTTTVYVTVTENGCDGSANVDVTFDDCTNIDNKNNDKEISIYPNPAKEQICIKTDSEIDVKLYTTAGKLLINEKIYSDLTINLNDLHAGVYILKIQNNKNIKTIKLIKE